MDKPMTRQVAVFENKDDGVLTDVTQTPRGFSVRLKDTDANEYLGTMRLFDNKADAMAFAKKAAGLAADAEP